MRRLLLALALMASPVAAQVSVTTPAPAVSAGLVVKTGTTLLTAIQASTGATAGYVLVLDAAAIPAAGAVLPKKCYQVAVQTAIEPNYRQSPLRFVNGAVILFSTAGCYTYTPSATAFLSGDVQ